MKRFILIVGCGILPFISYAQWGVGYTDMGTRSAAQADVANASNVLNTAKLSTNDTRAATLDGLTHMSNVWVSTSGSVGIGTNAPSELLEAIKDQNAETTMRLINRGAGVSSRSRYTAETETYAGGFQTTSRNFTTVPAWSNATVLYSSAPDLWLSAYGGNIRIQTGGTGAEKERMRIEKTTGYVGIGTNLPATLLDVNGAATVRGNLYVTNGVLVMAGIPTTTNGFTVSGSVWSSNNMLSVWIKP